MASCAEGAPTVQPPSGESITEPIPPPSLFADLPPDLRKEELEKLYRGKFIDELPSEERQAVIEANRRENLRAPTREALRSFASVQSGKASKSTADALLESR